MPATYKETIYRYRVMKHEELPAEHKASYRLNGIDPDTLWSLVWSFETEEDAAKMLAEEIETYREHGWNHVTWKMVDAGQTEVVERQAWF
jgi:hypothetical protein